MNRLFLLIILLFISSWTIGSSSLYDDLKFKNLSIEDGLSQSVVTFIHKDSHGFLWIGTQDGLNKYDGYEFKVYRYIKSDNRTISNNNIAIIDEDTNGNLWIATSGGGVNKYNRIKDSFEKIHFFSPEDSIKIQSNYISRLFIGSTNILWLGIEGNGFLRYDLNSQKVIDHFTTSNSKLSNNTVSYFEVDGDDVWISTNKGLNKFNKKTKEFSLFFQEIDEYDEYMSVLSTFVEDEFLWIATWGNGLIKLNKNDNSFINYIPDNNSNSIGSYYLNQVIVDDLGNKWIASWDGLLMFDEKNNFFYNWSYELINPNSITNNNVNHIYRDNENIFWISTWGGGINYFVDEEPAFKHVRKLPGSKETFGHSSIWSICEDINGNIWLGTEGGVSRKDKGEKQYRNYTYSYSDKNSIGDNTVYCIFEDSRKIMWIGTWTGGLNRYDPVNDNFIRYLPNDSEYSISSNIVNNIIEDNEGNLWISTSKGLNKFDFENNKFHNFKNDTGDLKLLSQNIVLQSFMSDDNHIWVASDGLGLFEYNPKNNSVKWYSNDEKDDFSISNNVIFSILEDDNKNIWCGTEAGLNILNRKTDKFTTISTDDGLNNDVIYGILKNQNDFWISTNSGISKIIFDYETDSVVEINNFTESDNLQSSEFNLGAFYKSRRGEFFFGGINGYNHFFPDDIHLEKSIPNIVFTDFQLFNESVLISSKNRNKAVFSIDSSINVKKEIVLNYDQNIISFEFAALDFKFPDKMNYKYILDGFDEKWNYTSAERRFVTYTNLKPGDYSFKVKCINHHGITSEEALDIKLEVLPPFWLTIWFYLIVFIVIVGLVYLYIYYRESSLKREKINLEYQVRKRTNKISAQKQEITDSIVYAKRIQNAILPNLKILKEISSDHFVIYNPKSIVSGDFYWFSEVNNIKIYVIADCTGHGVPGAFMSMLGISFLNKIVNENKITNPSEILNKLRFNIITSLHQTNTAELNDGMELAVVCLNKSTNTLYYAGAMNPAYIIQEDELVELKPDTMPISLHFKFDQPFKNKVLKYEDNAALYLFTDGLIDQFGGDQNKRFKSKKLKKILSEIYKLPFEDQKHIIEQEYQKWKGTNEQIDDVLMLGFRP
jgi:ligand-binding sensor domain-containing protein/serine phosphatase RsbU (regulator of sigma subunit)